MGNQPVVIENSTKVFYTVHINENTFVCGFDLPRKIVKVSNSSISSYEKPVRLERLDSAKLAAQLCGGTIKKHSIHTLATETIKEVNINE